MVKSELVGDLTPVAETRRASLIEKLSRALEESGISYCHWKSTEGLLRGFKEGDDLDLLVGASDATRFNELIHRFGFKKARGPRAREFPGVAHYYGLDESSGALVHLHAYYRLVLGHDATKNYRLPIEDAYLASASHGHIFPIPAPGFELAVLVLRLVLKHNGWDSMLRLEGSISAAERRELDLLTAVTDTDDLDEVVAQHLSFIGKDLFDDCFASVRPGAGVVARVAAARRLTHALDGCAKTGPVVDLLRKSWGRGSWVLRRSLDKSFVKKRLETGGAVVAVVGGDGSGKSSTVGELRGWIRGPLRARTVHLGKPPRSVARSFLKVWLSADRRLRRRDADGPADGPALGRAAGLRQVLVARDRSRQHTKVRRAATRGEVVICDRYPIPNIKLMDGPRLARFETSPRRSERLLAQLERRYYNRILPPDVLLVLRVDPHKAATRKIEEDFDFVRVRANEVWEIDWTQSAATVIDASQPLEDVVREAKEVLWSRL